MEEFPELNTDSDKHIDDFVSVVTSAERIFHRYTFEDIGKGELVRRRRKIASVIGKDKLRQIMQVLPPQSRRDDASHV